MLTLKELELGIIRCAERWPDRVGARGCYENTVTGDRCMLGEIAYGLGANPRTMDGTMFFDPFYFDGTETPNQRLAAKVVGLNDEGTPWGDIPRLLGLVPGEQPIEAPVASVEAESPVLEVAGV